MNFKVIGQDKDVVETVKIKLKLKEEFLERGYGTEYVSSFSKEAQEYIISRHNRGIAKLKTQGRYPKETGDNGYIALLGVWYYTKSRDIDCAIGLEKVWMASLINQDLI